MPSDQRLLAANPSTQTTSASGRAEALARKVWPVAAYARRLANSTIWPASSRPSTTLAQRSITSTRAR